MALVALLGEKAVNREGNEVDVSAISSRVNYVGLYFSAHWCPPCKSFTPVLAEFYNKYKAGAGATELEILFISSDRDEASWKDYFATMPWLSLPYSERDKKAELGTKFGVRGIPTFIIVNAKTGDVVTQDGRSGVMDDPEAKEFPWN